MCITSPIKNLQILHGYGYDAVVSGRYSILLVRASDSAIHTGVVLIESQNLALALRVVVHRLLE